MANISAQLLKELREMTGDKMMDCLSSKTSWGFVIISSVKKSVKYISFSLTS